MPVFSVIYVPLEKMARIFLIHTMNHTYIHLFAGISKKVGLSCSDLSGTKEVVVDVDDNGVISLNFECDQMSPNSKFVWSKNYEPIEDDSRLAIDTKGGK